MEAKPCVVEPEPHEGQQKVDLFVDLRDGVSDVFLVVPIVVAAASFCERVKFVLSDLVQSVR